jgi:membrane-associated protein
MSTILPFLINWLQEFGYPALWLVIFVASVGVPLPISLVLLAAGAFAALGDFNLLLLIFIATSASVCGDNVGYFIGRRWGTKALDWLGQSRMLRVVSPQTVTRSREYFKLRGGWAIFLSRFLFSGLGGVINLLAGADPYPYRRFLLYDVIGELIGAVNALLLGYVFGASWEEIGDVLGAFSGLTLALLVVILIAALLIKMLQRAKSEQAGQTRLTLDLEKDLLEQASLMIQSGQLPPLEDISKTRKEPFQEHL